MINISNLSRLASTTVLVITYVLGEQEACDNFWWETCWKMNIWKIKVEVPEASNIWVELLKSSLLPLQTMCPVLFNSKYVNSKLS
jgi:hypothetical protein